MADVAAILLSGSTSTIPSSRSTGEGAAPVVRRRQGGLRALRRGRAASARVLRDLGYSVFLDAKLHDIPHTVERGAYVLARYGLGYLNVHACGGVDMMRAAVAGATEGRGRRCGAAHVARVTVLTSDSDTERVQPAVAGHDRRRTWWCGVQRGRGHRR